MDFANLQNVFCCPECRSTALSPATDLTACISPFDASEGLRCSDCGREFPRVGQVWVMWSDEVKALQLEAAVDDAGVSSQVKKANIDVYRDASQHYGEHTCPRHLDEIRELKTFAGANLTGRRRVIVDVGCATGIGLADGDFGDALVVGVDISLQNLFEVDAELFTPVLADAEKLPFRDGAVDMITCFAAMHHFPDPAAFLTSSSRCLRAGGVCLTGADPSRAAQKIGPLARFVFHLRRPVYRVLARWFSRYYLHRDSSVQKANDLAEYQRTRGGFDPAELDRMFRNAGFSACEVFLGSTPSRKRKWQVPAWKTFILKTLSFQNPFLAANYANVAAVGQK